MSRLRHDPLTGEPILFAPERRDRPNAFDQQPAPESQICPFCPGNEDQTPPEIARIGTAETWDVRVVPNRYPMVGHGGLKGVHEVVIETPQHEATFASLSSGQRTRVLRAYRDRFASHRRNRSLRHLVIFRNEGQRAGQSLKHPHAQIVGLPFIPDRIRRESALLRGRRKRGEPCPVCAEAGDAREMVGENEHFIALAPFASRSPFQVRVLPRRHAADFGQIDDRETGALEELLGRVVRAMESGLGTISWNLLIQSAPLYAAGTDAFHWSVDVVPRLTVDGGFELATGIPINIVPPEEAAERLRNELRTVRQT